MTRALKILYGLDQFLTVCFLAKAKQNQTFSSLCWEWDISGRRKWPRKAVDALFRLFGERDHCRESWENEDLRARELIEVRRGDE